MEYTKGEGTENARTERTDANRVRGIVERVIFRNEENGYTVLLLKTRGKAMTMVGFFPTISEGLSIEAEGRMVSHASYGEQFKVESYSEAVPEGREAIERYLAAGAIKGIGEALAARIVKMFGKDTLRILEEQPERLAEVRGISQKKAREIARQVDDQRNMRRAMIFLQKYGITLAMGVRIYNKYGEEIYDILQQNPYRLAEDIHGIGFKTADAIAAKVGIPEDSEYRIRCGILHVLGLAVGEGSVYLPEEELLANAEEILGVSRELIQNQLQDLALSRRITLRDMEKEEGRERIVYLTHYFQMERGIAQKLCELSRVLSKDTAAVEKQLLQIGRESGIELAKEQTEAVVLAATNGLLVMTGGPGTGKTTTVSTMLRYFRSLDLTILLAAPTGRAARRMTEATGCEASTIHRLLEVSSTSEDMDGHVHFERNADNPLEADVIIIDEMSMVDVALMYALLQAVPVGTRLVLVGDVDQLPSVGPGAVLRDVLAAEIFPAVRLQHIFRQAAASDIVTNAHRINRGEEIRLDNKSRDFFFLRRQNVDHIVGNMILLIREKLPKYVHARPYDIQILTPMRKGPLGVERLNVLLQAQLNPADPSKAEKAFGEGIFREGDKVMQVRNNYELVWEIRGRYGTPVHQGEGIFNGDLGIIRQRNHAASYMTIEFDDGRFVEYPYGCLEDLELAYAVTIHKSQGSEYPAVLLPLLSGPKLLFSRNLLYTAVTRAKSCVVILGSEETVQMMIDNRQDSLRYTSLRERILENWEYVHPGQKT